MDLALALLETLEACLSSQRSVEGTAVVEIHEELDFMSSLHQDRRRCFRGQRRTYLYAHHSIRSTSLVVIFRVLMLLRYMNIGEQISDESSCTGEKIRISMRKSLCSHSSLILSKEPLET